MLSMTRRLFSAVATAALLMPGVAFAQEKTIMLDFVVLNNGVELQERIDYEELIRPVTERHGMSVLHRYNLDAHLDGALEDAARLLIWEMDSPAALQAVLEDPEYVPHTGQRDEIHNMRALTIYMGGSAQDEGQITDTAVLVDLVVMNDGFGAEERAEYEASIEPIAARHGLTKIATFPIGAKAAGRGPETPLQLNLWRVEDPAGLQALFADPEFATHVDRRNELHNFDELTLFLASPGN